MFFLLDSEEKDEILEFGENAKARRQDFEKLTICTQATVRVMLSNKRDAP